MPLRRRIAGLLGSLMGAMTLPLLLWGFSDRLGAFGWVLTFCCGCATNEVMHLVEKFRKGE